MLNVIYLHLSRRASIYLWAFVAFIAFGRFFAITVNVSDSLPGTVFLVQKGVSPQKGEMVAFRYNGGGPYQAGMLFMKRVTGMPGSVVVNQDAGHGSHDFFVDGDYVGRAKPFSKGGMPLSQGPSGTIPDGHFYVMAPHPDSLDSRYALVGWVSKSQIVGRAITIF